MKCSRCQHENPSALKFIAFDRIEELERMLIQGEIHLEPIPREALFLPGNLP